MLTCNIVPHPYFTNCFLLNFCIIFTPTRMYFTFKIQIVMTYGGVHLMVCKFNAVNTCLLYIGTFKIYPHIETTVCHVFSLVITRNANFNI